MADDDVMTVSGQDQQPDAPNVPPAVFGNLSQGQSPDVGQANPAPPTLAPQPVQRPGGGNLPLLAQALAEVFKPPSQYQAPGPGQIAVQRPVSRAADFENFLGTFFQGVGMGFANEGHGPGAALRGAGAAMLGPQQYAMQRAQFQQQQAQAQAQTQEAQARAALTSAQAQPVNIEGVGDIPAGSLGGYFQMQGKLGAAQTAAQASTQNAQLASQTKLLTTAITNPSLPLDPALAAAAGHPEWANQLIGKAQLSALTSEINTKTKLVGTVKTGEQIREDSDGNLIKIPVTSTSRPNLLPVPAVPAIRPATGPVPGVPAIRPTVPSAPQAASAPSGSRVVAQGKLPPLSQGMDAQGNMIAGTPSELRAAGVAPGNMTKMEAADQSKVLVARQLISPKGLFSAVQNDLQQLGGDNLGPIASRWNEFMSGKVGTGPQFAALRTDMGLLGTALMQAHVGARGGEDMREHFQNLADYRISDAPTLRSALAAEYRYVHEKAMLPRTQ